MSEVQTPSWLEGWKPAPPPPPKRGKPGNPNWQKGMRSPNPAGRPPGPTPQTRLMQRMLDDADGIVDAMVAKALEGDSASASLILSRVLPALNFIGETPNFSGLRRQPGRLVTAAGQPTSSRISSRNAPSEGRG